MFIPIILGTAREGRESEKVAKFLEGEATKVGIESEILDVRDYRIRATDNSGEISKAKKLKKKVASAGALIIVSPEYNHSYPGELKMMLDMLFFEYSKKPVGICGVSAGDFGGARGADQLRLLCTNLNMIPISNVLYFSRVEDQFDRKGKILEKKYITRAKRFLEELVEYSQKG